MGYKFYCSILKSDGMFPEVLCCFLILQNKINLFFPSHV